MLKQTVGAGLSLTIGDWGSRIYGLGLRVQDLGVIKGLGIRLEDLGSTRCCRYFCLGLQVL